MATQLLTLTVFPRGKPIKNLPEETALPRAAPTSQIYQTLAAKSGISIHRLRVTKGSDGQLVPNDKDLPIIETGLLDGSKILVKDLGPQISWKTVFIIEYIGPLIIHPLLLLLRPYIYSWPESEPFPPLSGLQYVSFAMICIHYIKREIETIFVHRFSAATMPARNIFKNSFHYWGLSGLLLGYFIYSPTAPTAGGPIPFLTGPGIFFFVMGEMGNLFTHLTLRGLRKEGGKERGIPVGIGFGLVTCPNYMFECLAWFSVLLVTRSWSTAFFLAVSLVQMAIWAKKKERRYRTEFGDKYKSKKYGIIPGVI